MGISVDVVLTSDDSLSGTATRDGVTLTAGVTRALAVAQNTSSGNGPWLVQSGAWTRPSDYNVDVDYVVGQYLFVQSGATGAGSNWQLTSGTTVAGAKNYAKVPADCSCKAPVRAVQTAKLTSWVYNKTAGTLTAPVNGALPSPWTLFDNVVTPVNGDRYEVFGGIATIGGAVAENGVYTLVNGTVSTPAVLTRVTELDSNAEFLTGASYYVYDGASAAFKGTARALQTLVVNLTATTPTPIAIGPLNPRDTLRINLATDPRYLVRTFVLAGDATANPDPRLTNGDSAQLLRQAMYDAKKFTTFAGNSSTGHRAVIDMPNPGGEGVLIDSPFPMADYTRLNGNRVHLLSSFRQAGFAITSWPQDAPTVGGSAVDTASTTPLAMYDTTGGTNDVRFNFTDGAGLHFGAMSDHSGNNLTVSLSAVECKFFESFTLIPGTGVGNHIGSCAGRRLAASSGANDSVDVLFSFYLVGSRIRMILRTRDVTAGVYSAVTAGGTGGSTSVCTADSVLKPTSDCVVVLKVLTGGTIGVAGIKLAYSSDNGNTWYTGSDGLGFALGTATSFTIDELNIPRPFKAKFNFSAGTLVTGATFTCTCSGVEQITTLTTAIGSVAINTIYEITGRYDWFTQTVGLTLSTPNAVPVELTATATGEILQWPWEETMWGVSRNLAFCESGSGQDAAHGFLGSIRFLGTQLVRQTGTPTYTFADLGGGVGTITRSVGDFRTVTGDGFANGQKVRVSQSNGNNGYYLITNVTATVITVSGSTFAAGAQTGVVLHGIPHSAIAAPVNPTPDSLPLLNSTQQAPTTQVGQLMHWLPKNTGNVTDPFGFTAPGAIYQPDGLNTTVWYWRCVVGTPQGANRWGFLAVGRENALFSHGVEINDLNFNGSQMTSGIRLHCCPESHLRGITMNGVQDALKTTGPSFYSSITDCRLSATRRAWVSSQAEHKIASLRIDGGEVMLGASIGTLNGVIDMNAEDGSACFVILNQLVGSNDIQLNIDDENITGGKSPRECIRANCFIGNPIRLSGTLNSGGSKMILLAIGPSDPTITSSPIIIDDCSIGVNPLAPCVVAALDNSSSSGLAKLGPGAVVNSFLPRTRPPILGNRPGVCIPYGGYGGKGALLTNIDATIDFSSGARRFLPPGTLTADHTLTLTRGGVDGLGIWRGLDWGSRWEFAIGVQAHDYIFHDANGTEIDRVVAGKVGRCRFTLADDGVLVEVAP